MSEDCTEHGEGTMVYFPGGECPLCRLGSELVAIREKVNAKYWEGIQDDNTNLEVALTEERERREKVEHLLGITQRQSLAHMEDGKALAIFHEGVVKIANKLFTEANRQRQPGNTWPVVLEEWGHALIALVSVGKKGSMIDWPDQVKSELVALQDWCLARKSGLTRTNQVDASPLLATRDELNRVADEITRRITRLQVQRDQMQGEPWPLQDVLPVLVKAARHLLDDHDCDAHGHENIQRCIDRAKSYVGEG